MKKLLALVLFLLSLPSWGGVTVTLTTTAAPDPPGTFYTVSIPDVAQMKANAPAGQHVYVFVGVLRKLNGAGLIPVDLLSLSPGAPFVTTGGISGNGVTVTSFTFDPLALSNPPVNVTTPGSTAGMSIAIDQGSFTTTNMTSILGGMQPGDSIYVVVGTGSTPTAALTSGLINGTTAQVYQKPMMTVAPASLAADHTVGTTPCPEAMGSINVTSLLGAGQALDVSVTSSNKVFRMNGAGLSNAISGSLSVAAGTPATISVSYDCSVNPTQTGTITLVGGTAGVNGSQSATVTVTVTAK